MSQSNAACPCQGFEMGPRRNRILEPVFPKLLVKLPRSTTLHQANPGATDTRHLWGENKILRRPLSVASSDAHCAAKPAERKKITLCCNLQPKERMEENSNTGSRKHDVSNSTSLSQCARYSRGQV